MNISRKGSIRFRHSLNQLNDSDVVFLSVFNFFPFFATRSLNSCHYCGCGYLLLPFDRSNCWWKLLRAAPAGKRKLRISMVENSRFWCAHLNTPLLLGVRSVCVKWIRNVFPFKFCFPIVRIAEWKSVDGQIFSYQCAPGWKNKNKWKPVEEQTMPWVYVQKKTN